MSRVSHVSIFFRSPYIPLWWAKRLKCCLCTKQNWRCAPHPLCYDAVSDVLSSFLFDREERCVERCLFHISPLQHTHTECQNTDEWTGRFGPAHLSYMSTLSGPQLTQPVRSSVSHSSNLMRFSWWGAVRPNNMNDIFYLFHDYVLYSHKESKTGDSKKAG